MSRAELDVLYGAALQAGARPAQDDCVGGDLRGCGCGACLACEAVTAYRSAARAAHAYAYGPALRAYYHEEADS